MTESLLCRVTPFGNPGITGCLLLPLAFRSLPRPSSPDSSKASSVDPYSLDHITVCSVSFSVAVRRVRPPSPFALLRRLRGRQSRLFAARRYIGSLRPSPKLPSLAAYFPFSAAGVFRFICQKIMAPDLVTGRRRRNHSRLFLVEVKGLEPLTPRMQI